MELSKIIVEILSQRLPEFHIQSNPQPLSGGLLNYVWRVAGDSKSNPRSMIIKWSPPFIASMPGVELNPKMNKLTIHLPLTGMSRGKFINREIDRMSKSDHQQRLDD